MVLNDIIDLAALLIIWRAWHEDQYRPRRLHFIVRAASLPSSIEWLKMAHEQLPDPSSGEWLATLGRAWALDVPGVQRFELDGQSVTLTWCVGSHVRPDLLGVAVDDVVDTTDLDLDFGVEDRRHKIRQHYLQQAAVHPWSWTAKAPAQRHAMVVGAGFAGVGVAHSLALRGWRVTLLDRGWHGTGGRVHSSHLAAALTPVASKDDNARARLSRTGTLIAHQRWQHLDESIVSRCGALQLQRSNGRTKPLDEVVNTLEFSKQWIDYLSAEEASDRAGMALRSGGIWYPLGCLVRPGAFIDAMTKTPGVDVHDFTVNRIFFDKGLWHAVNVQGETTSAPLIVMANAGGVKPVLQNSDLWPEQGRLSHMHSLAGQITMIPKQRINGGPRCIVGGDGYVLPAVNDWCVSGGTYVRGAEHAEITEKGVQENLARAVNLLGLENDLHVNDQTVLPGWAGWRAVLPGRLPAVGPLKGQAGLWVATGYASRGLTWSSLAGELIAGFLESEPLLLESDVLGEIGVI
jgi:tRNA 5-methylaminomethyl-2-thiouridine biosynthesis bifunctional protein